jgi:hypothetical protein
VRRLLDKLRRFRFPSLDRSDHTSESGQRVENTDAWTATGGHGLDPTGGSGHADFPPDYVKQDDGRPRY